MKIYVGKNKKSAKEISLKSLLTNLLTNDLEDAEVEPDRFSDNSASWINIDKVNDKNKQLVSIVIGFDPDDDNKFVDLKVWVAPIKTIVDNDKCKNII